MAVKPNSWDRSRVELGALDFLALTASFFAAYYLRFWAPLFNTFKYVPIDFYLYAWPVVSVVFIAGFSFLGLYDTRKPYSRLAIFMDCFKGILLGTLLVLPLSFWVRHFTYSRIVVIMNAALLIIIMPILRNLYQNVIKQRRALGRDPVRLLVIGTGEQADVLHESLKTHPELGYTIKGFLNVDGQSGKSINGYPVLGNLNELVHVLHKHNIQEVVLAHEELDPQKEFLILQPCRAEGVGIKVMPALYDFALAVRGLRVIDNMFWYCLEMPVSQRWYAFVKRGIDIGVSAVMLIPTGLLLPLLAVLIRMESPGSIIFSQRRTGTNGKPFKMYKFRSMIQNAEKILPNIIDVDKIEQPAFKLANDPRVTRLGRSLRRLSLDELPQFYNVLRGDMSLVGPRPEELWIAEKYNAKERARLQVKPGIAGFQQIHCRGTEDFSDRLRHDLYYINNQSLFLDLSIMLETLWVVFQGKGRH